MEMKLFGMLVTHTRHFLVQEYVHKFESEHIRLHMLLDMDHNDLANMGIHSYGHREMLRDGVKEYLRAYLRAAENINHISAKY